ncbi:ATP-binding cassette domain-containing protein [Parafrankia soli]|uniref:ATP-binding cassette domain-containing protein n=1 Tax=Parafrankia soli TaxID=2599596 RepID=UPI003B5896C3
MSRRHLMIEATIGGWTVRDISSNGTWQLGQRVRRIDILTDEVKLNLGAVTGPAVTLVPVAQQPMPVTPQPLPVTPPPAPDLPDLPDLPDPPLPLPLPLQHEPMTVARDSLLIRSGLTAPGTGLSTPPPTTDQADDASQQHRASYLLRLGRTSIGRAKDNDIVVGDLLASRVHAEILVGRGGAEVVDLNSVNGTFVNGNRITRAVLHQRDVIAIGHHLFQLVGDELLEFIDSGDVTFEADGLNVFVDGKVQLLHDISFRLPAGALLAVIGPSGSGKSTLLNALTGFRPADTGTVRYASRDMYAHYDELRRRIGYVPQEDILHTLLTVREALEYGARLRFPADTTAAERRARIDEVLEELGLTTAAEQYEESLYGSGQANPAGVSGAGDSASAGGGNSPDTPAGTAGDLADRRVQNLSGGQRKRTSVALELLTQPTLLYLDEPTSGLDPGLDKEVMEALRRLADGGRTVIVVTHSVAQLDLCDYVLALAHGGHMAYFGAPQNALRFFGEGDWADVFRMLKTIGGSKRSVERFRTSNYFVPASVIAPTARPNPADLPGVRQQGVLSQAVTLSRRYLRVIAADKVYLRLIVVLPFLLGLITQVVPARNKFNVVRLPNVEAGQVLLIIVLAASFMGLANAISEVVKERAIYRRERSIGLSRVAYLGSKVGVMTLMTVLQSIVFTLIATSQRTPPHAAALGSPKLEVLIAVTVLTWASSMFGLLMSSLVDSTDKVMPLLVLSTVTQLVFCGGFFPLAGKTGLNQFSYLFPTRWCFAAVASTADLNVVQKLGDPVLNPAKGPDPRWRHASSVYLTNIGVGVAVGVLLIILTFLLLRRMDPRMLRRDHIGRRMAGAAVTPPPPGPPPPAPPQFPAPPAPASTVSKRPPDPGARPAPGPQPGSGVPTKPLTATRPAAPSAQPPPPGSRL